MPSAALPEPTGARRPTPAFDALLAEIGHAFGTAAEIDGFKRDCRRIIRRHAANPRHEALFRRYGARAQLLRSATTAQAAILVDGWYRRERKAFQVASALGGGTRLSLMVLRELRLLVRLMRAKRLGLQPVIADVLGEAFAETAE